MTPESIAISVLAVLSLVAIGGWASQLARARRAEAKLDALTVRIARTEPPPAPLTFPPGGAA